jgi:serine/threonine protein kinase
LKIFAFDILTALDEMHSRGIIHCDIKPQNFLLFGNAGHTDDSFDENIVLKITDFGLCHYIDPNTGKAEMKIACGTFNYKAPEIQNVRIKNFSYNKIFNYLFIYDRIVL